MIAAYGPYAASATGGNDLARDFLAGVAALYSTPCKSSHCSFYMFCSMPPRPRPRPRITLSHSLRTQQTLYMAVNERPR
jgi:hypothetical protein